MLNQKAALYAMLARLTIAGICLTNTTPSIAGQTDTAPAGSLRSIPLAPRSLLLIKALSELENTDSAARAESVRDPERAEQDVRAFRQAIEDLWQKTARWEALAAHPDFADPDFGRALAGWAYRHHDRVLLQTVTTSGLLPADDADMVVYQRLGDLAGNPKARILVEALAHYGGAESVTGPARDPNETYYFVSSLLSGVDTRYVARRAQAVLHAPAAPPFTPTQKTLLQTLANLIPAPDPTPLAQQRKQGYYDAAHYQFIAPRPDALPTLTPGQRFLYLPGGESTALTDATTGAAVPGLTQALHVLRLQTVKVTQQEPEGDTFDLTIKTAGEGPTLRWQGTGSLYDLPGLFPLVEDDTVRALRRRYQSHVVHPYNTRDVTIVTEDAQKLRTYQMSNPLPAKVAAIYRLRTGAQFTAAIGGYGEYQETIYTHDPLLVVWQVPGQTEPMQSWRARAEKHVPDLPSPASVKYSLFADAWDFERTCTLTSFTQAARTWPAKQRRAALRGEVIPGMTPEQVAYLKGWPAIYGSKAELSRRSVWDYPRPAPFYQTVSFSKGHVTRYDEGGMLP